MICSLKPEIVLENKKDKICPSVLDKRADYIFAKNISVDVTLSTEYRLNLKRLTSWKIVRDAYLALIMERVRLTELENRERP